MNKNEYLTPVPDGFKWPQCPEAEQFILNCLDGFLKNHPFAGRLAARMEKETSTSFIVWTDHIVLPRQEYDAAQLKEKYGFIPDPKAIAEEETTVLYHPYADLPRVLLSDHVTQVACAIHVEDVAQFQMIHGLSIKIEGAPYSAYRLIRIPQNKSEFFVVERRGIPTFVVDNKDNASEYLKRYELCLNRPRFVEDETAGLKATLALVKKCCENFDQGMAAWIFLEAERAYWQHRNTAAQIQKARQDSLGLGWANHDHHTFRSSRSHFPALIEILLALGFKKRERFYAGADAGWGAQVMEQPAAGLIIFADVDLLPEDSQVDFSTQPLKDLDQPRTVGLWCALHGESMLQAGLHHLEAQFNFDHLRESLMQLDIETMKPFSDFPHLRQAFTQGEKWQVQPQRLDRLKAKKGISDEAYEKIKIYGAVGSHLENLQRKDGFKGFNQRGVSDIITAVNPETQALEKD